MRAITILRLLGVCVFFVVAGLGAHGQDGSKQDASAQAQQWADENLEKALDDLFPLNRPDPAREDQDCISYRYQYDFLLASREYSFSLVRRSYERPGTLAFYWLAFVRIAEGAQIRHQLATLRDQHPDRDLAETENSIKVRSWTLDAKSCPSIAIQATKFQRLSFEAPFNSNIVLDTPQFEFQVNSFNAHMSASLLDGKHPLVVWAKETRVLLSKCGLAETAPIKLDQ
jgi:hypothetical protein